MFADPSDPTYVYAESQGGYIGRINRKTHEMRDIQPLPSYKEGKLRFNWNTPIHMSPTRSGTLYIGAQFLFRSRDHGQTWQRISPDLTTNDTTKQQQEQSGGVTVDNSSAETHTTIFAIGESPKDSMVVWAGTDDGNLQVTRDGGKDVDERRRQHQRTCRRTRGSRASSRDTSRGHDLRDVRSPHVRRHASVRVSLDRLRQDVDAARRAAARRCAGTRT